MELKIIKTKKQYRAYLDWIDNQFDKKVKRNTSAGEKLQLALLLVKQFEDEHFLIPTPNPISMP